MLIIKYQLPEEETPCVDRSPARPVMMRWWETGDLSVAYFVGGSEDDDFLVHDDSGIDRLPAA